MSWLFASGGQSIGASSSASVLPMSIQDLFPLGFIGLTLQSKGLSKVFFNTTVQKHQLFGTQPSLWFNSHMCTWLLEKLHSSEQLYANEIFLKKKTYLELTLGSWIIWIHKKKNYILCILYIKLHCKEISSLPLGILKQLLNNVHQ